MTASTDWQALRGKVALITGAGSGVGRATAVALARRGMRSALVGRSVAQLEETALLVEAAGGKALIAPADVADEAAVGAAMARAVQGFGGVDVLIAAAAIGRYGPVESYPLADWQATLATNLTGVFLCAKAVLPTMRDRGGGAIVAIASGAAKQGYPNLSAYAASKFGLLGFMQSLAEEVRDDGIKVSTILPGSIATGFAGKTPEDVAAGRAQGRKYLEPEDVANAIVYLLEQPAHAWTQELNLWPF
jgi:3-oxoacyl-[acyl-carrier protein] reductase